jgi:CheY-like chemotaxis protein
MTMAESASGQKAPKILIVDDEEPIRTLAAASIQHTLGETWSIAFAATGEEALARVACERPDLVLLDIMMPGMDGFEVCRRLKACPETSSIRVVFLTGVGDESAITEGLRIGGEGYILKPFNPVTLAAQIAELLVPGGA